MKPHHGIFKTATRTGLALATLAIAQPLYAINMVDFVDVADGGGININDGKIVVEPVNGVYANVVTGNTVTYHKRLRADCTSNNYLRDTYVAFGTEYANGTIKESSDNYRVDVPSNLVGEIPFTDVVLNVPLNKLGFDPVQACQDMLASKMQQGLTKMQVMNSDQTLNSNVVFSGVAACANTPNTDNIYWKTDTIGDTLKVICKGGPSGPVSQVAQPKLPIVAVPLGGGGQIQAGHQPLQITQAQVMTNVLHDSGQCPANKQFSVGYKGHGKGHIRFHVIKSGQNIYTSVPLAYEGADGFVQRNFFYQVDLDPQKPWEVVGKELERSFSLLIEIKDEKADDFDWSPHGYYTGLDWFYTCQPKLNAVIPNQNMGYGQQPQPPALPGGQIQAQPIGPMPPASPAGKVQPQPVEPKQPMQIAPQPLEPSPPPSSTLQIAPMPVEPKPQRAR